MEHHNVETLNIQINNMRTPNMYFPKEDR